MDFDTAIGFFPFLAEARPRGMNKHIYSISFLFHISKEVLFLPECRPGLSSLLHFNGVVGLLSFSLFDRKWSVKIHVQFEFRYYWVDKSLNLYQPLDQFR